MQVLKWTFTRKVCQQGIQNFIPFIAYCNMATKWCNPAKGYAHNPESPCKTNKPTAPNRFEPMDTINLDTLIFTRPPITFSRPNG